jgi:hypothetical protein
MNTSQKRMDLAVGLVWRQLRGVGIALPLGIQQTLNQCLLYVKVVVWVSEES